MARRKPDRERLTVQARGLEAIIFECAGCGCRIEVEPDNATREEMACPCCGASLAAEHQLFQLYAALCLALAKSPEPVCFRVALRRDGRS